MLQLHVAAGSTIADITYGRGVFWKKVDTNQFHILATDIQTGVDCRNLPYGHASLDWVVFDPPYMESMYRDNIDHMGGKGSYASFRNHYTNSATIQSDVKGHAAVVAFYVTVAHEVYRVLKPKGGFIVKCQDEVSAGKQWLTHVEIINAYAEIGYTPIDLFVVVRRNRAAVSRIVKQRHARKNHSYILVFRKR